MDFKPDSAVERPTFLLGVGCQKGGTTWLHQYFARFPECAPGFGKEATIFDSIDVPQHTFQRRKVLERATASLSDLQRGEVSQSATDLLRAAMMIDTSVYFDFFAARAHLPGKRFTLDFTTNYALLSSGRLRQIREEFDRRGVNTKPIFIMRDPVDRIWSQIRMHLRDHAKNKPSLTTSETEAELVLQRYTRPTIELRTRYEWTLANLKSVFDRPNLYVGVYERLFTKQAVGELCAFVGTDARPADYSTKINSSSRDRETLPTEVVATVARHYRETYAAAAEFLQLSDMTSVWPSAWLLD